MNTNINTNNLYAWILILEVISLIFCFPLPLFVALILVICFIVIYRKTGQFMHTVINLVVCTIFSVFMYNFNSGFIKGMTDTTTITGFSVNMTVWVAAGITMVFGLINYLIFLKLRTK